MTTKLSVQFRSLDFLSVVSRWRLLFRTPSFAQGGPERMRACSWISSSMKEVWPEWVSSRMMVWEREFAKPIDGVLSLIDSTDKDDGVRPLDPDRLCYYKLHLRGELQVLLDHCLVGILLGLPDYFDHRI